MPRINIEVRCIHCQTNHIIPVDHTGYTQWIQGALIQQVLPGLSEDQRELLISRTCGECWREMFLVDDEEPDEEAFNDSIDNNPDNIDVYLYDQDAGDR